MTCLVRTIIAAQFFQAALIFEWRQRVDMSRGFRLHAASFSVAKIRCGKTT